MSAIVAAIGVADVRATTELTRLAEDFFWVFVVDVRVVFFGRVVTLRTDVLSRSELAVRVMLFFVVFLFVVPVRAVVDDAFCFVLTRWVSVVGPFFARAAMFPSRTAASARPMYDIIDAVKSRIFFISVKDVSKFYECGASEIYCRMITCYVFFLFFLLQLMLKCVIILVALNELWAYGGIGRRASFRY